MNYFYCYPGKSILLSSLFILLMSCNTGRHTVALTTSKPNTAENSVGAYQIKTPDFKTLKINGNIEYTKGKNSQSASLDIRIIKNEKILISVSYIIPIAKILLTPDSVSYYDMIHKTFYKGDYSIIKNISDIDFTFKQVQNILLGLPLYETNPGNFQLYKENQGYRSVINLSDTLSEEIWLMSDYLLARQRVVDLGINAQTLDISYNDYSPYLNFSLPDRINITAEKNEKYEVSISYDKCKINEYFPFQIPNGYKPVEINN